MHTMSDPQRVGWRYLCRLGLVAILSALFFWWLLRLPFTSGGDPFDSSVKPTGPVFADARRLPIRSSSDLLRPIS